MRRGLLGELVGVFEDAKEHRRTYGDGGVEGRKAQDDLLTEILALLREGDRLRRRADGPPSSEKGPRRPAGASEGQDRAAARSETKDAS